MRQCRNMLTRARLNGDAASRTITHRAGGGRRQRLDVFVRVEPNRLCVCSKSTR